MGADEARPGRAAAFHRLPPGLQNAGCALHAGLHADAARDIAREVGLHYVYTGNVHDETGKARIAQAVATA